MQRTAQLERCTADRALAAINRRTDAMSVWFATVRWVTSNALAAAATLLFLSQHAMHWRDNRAVYYQVARLSQQHSSWLHYRRQAAVRVHRRRRWLAENGGGRGLVDHECIACALAVPPGPPADRVVIIPLWRCRHLENQLFGYEPLRLLDAPAASTFQSFCSLWRSMATS